jgi:hypothetical protein
MKVLVGAAVLVNTGIVFVGTTVVPTACVGTTLPDPGGGAVPVTKEAPGVRKTFTQAGCVRMAGSTGSTNPPGLVRKSLFGLSLDSISASSVQVGEKSKPVVPRSITGIQQEDEENDQPVLALALRLDSSGFDFTHRSVHRQTQERLCRDLFFVVAGLSSQMRPWCAFTIRVRSQARGPVRRL